MLLKLGKILEFVDRSLECKAGVGRWMDRESERLQYNFVPGWGFDM